MRLRKAASYGVLAVGHLAAHDTDGPIPGPDVAKALGVPPQHVLKVLPRLARSHVLNSERGRNGGFYLAKPADKTTLLEILESIDGPMTGRIEAGRTSKIPARSRKKLERIVADLAAYQRSKLKRVTVKQLMP